MKSVVWILSLAWWPAAAHADCLTEGEVVLNEIAPAVPGDDANAEWVELFNPGDTTVQLDGWRVERATAAGTETDDPGDYSLVFELPAATVLEPGAWLLVGGDLVVPPEGVDAVLVTAAADMGNAGSNSDAIRLVDCDGQPRDVIAYGTNNNGGVFLDEELEQLTVDFLAPKPSDTKTAARVPDGADTNNGAVDFVRQDPTPGFENGSEGGSAVCTSSAEPGAVVINELMTDPGAAVNPSGTSDTGYEWFEIYNASTGPILIEGWTFLKANAADGWDAAPRFTFPAGATLEAGAHAVVAEHLVTFPEDAEVDVYRLSEDATLAMGNSEDAVRLMGCGGDIVDMVVYGGGNPDGFFEGDVVFDDAEVAPDPSSDMSLSRVFDGYDTNDSGHDFVVVDTPTPGLPNPDLRCKGTGLGVVINEMLVNPKGTDSAVLGDWIELYNGSDDPIDISTWTIHRASSYDDETDQPKESQLVAIPPGTVLEAKSFFVLGALLADIDTPDDPFVDHYVDPFDLYSGSGGDLVVLRDCDGTRVDGVVYGDDNEDRMSEDDGSVPAQGVRKPSDDQCIARVEDGADSDASVDDFLTTSYCSPGFTNYRAPTDPGEPVAPPSSGCGGGPRNVAPKTVDPDQACSTGAGTRWTWMGWAVVLVALRRRR